MVMHVVDCFLFYYLTHSVWLHEILPWDWLLYSADICVFLLPLCVPSVPTPSFSDSPSILSFSLLVFWWAVGLVCSSALAFCSSWLVLFKIWCCPIQICTVQLPLLQTTLISSFLFLRSFLCTPSNFPVSLCLLGKPNLYFGFAVLFGSHSIHWFGYDTFSCIVKSQIRWT